MKQPSRHGIIAGLSAALAGALCLTAVPGAFAADSPDVSALIVHGGAQRIANTPATGKAKNVILFIGDGMGDSEITIARDYLYGPGGSFEGLDKIGQPGATSAKETGTGQYTTYATGDGSGRRNQVTAVTDSAASGSGWATGTKTYNNAVSVDNNFNPQMNLIELAKAKGLATGNVTTAEIQDATPAVLESHSTQRSCYGPQGKTDGSSDDSAKRCDVAQLKQNGGIGSISEQLLDTRADVTFGGGSKYFNQTAQAGEYQGMTLKDQAKARGYQYVEDPAQLGSLSEADQSSPVLGLFAAGNLPPQYNESKTYDGKTAQEIALKGQQDGNASLQTCTANPDWLGSKGASLADMTNKAIDLLSANKNGKDNGYFLQVEGASIDKQDHNANACGQIGETDDLDKAISAALKKVDLSNTLIIVTADHAHTSQLASWPSMYALNTPLCAKDGTAMYVMYGTASSQNGSQSHTGTQLRIAASGPGASRVDGLTDQTDNFFTVAKTLGLASSTEDINALSSGAKVFVKDGVAQVTGFNGDAVLGYQLQDTETGAVLAASNDDTPVSGVRVATGATTTIDFNGVKGFDPSGSTYTLTVTGKQSGTKIATEFGLTGNGASNVVVAPKTAAKAGLGDAAENGGIAGALVGALGKTGTRILGTVMVALALAVAGGLLAAWRRGLFARK
ncbi:alkaline phosphatase [Bifidobacterium boum]|uniref:alkaline phosphatase n=1 Tax=Bifidobacterium boum TaxID=78343 RepID=UPI00242E092E|nr:alkaline phosphatase [Bifidobacterium boum]MCI5860854.1 alkaline phosphatase [Bifidobacterium boum]